MKYKFLFFILLSLGFTPAKGQDGTTAFNFLRLPVSSHAAALGGSNISIIDDDITLAMHNPALLINVSDKTMNINYMTYMSDSKVAGASFNKIIGERSVVAIAARYVDYGTFDGYTEDNTSNGTFQAKDIEINILYSYMLSERWSGGVTGKFIYSKYESFGATALGVDLGLNYYNEESEFSMSLTARNLGGQISSFEDRNEVMPINLQLGFSKRLARAPIRLSVTLNDLSQWGSSYFYNADGEKDNFGELLMKHIVLGADLMIGSNFYVSLGYNYRIAKELSASSSKWEGITAGAGLTLKRVKLGASYSKLHTSSSSLLFNFSYGF